jgi:2-keto-4-pentenoate hydratase
MARRGGEFQARAADCQQPPARDDCHRILCGALCKRVANREEQDIMTPDQVTAAARLIAQARETGTPIPELPEPCHPLTVADAHAIQDAVTRLLGRPVAAFKANAPADDEPNRGVIYDVYPSPARIPASRVPLCGVEGEVAFRFTRDLAPRTIPYTRDEVTPAIEACAAIEVVHSRFEDQAARSFLEKLADCISNGAFVPAGTRPGWQSLHLGKLHVTLRVNGETVVEQDGGHPSGDPVGVAVALVNMMRSGSGVRASQYVTCGSCTGLRFLKPGDTCAVTFDGLGSAEVIFTG